MQGHLSKKPTIKELAEMVAKAVQEKPIRSEHYYTGDSAFFIVGDKIYTWKDWGKIPPHQRESAMPVHSHSGIGDPPGVDFSPLNREDIYLWLKAYKAGQYGSPNILIANDGRMEILEITNTTSPLLFRLTRKQLTKELERTNIERTAYYEKYKDDPDWSTYKQERELLRAFADKYGLTYRMNLRWK